MDIALVLSKIRPNAKWRMADTYEHLQETWEDEKQVIPTLEELQTSWTQIQKEVALTELNKSFLAKLVPIERAIAVVSTDTTRTQQQKDDAIAILSQQLLTVRNELITQQGVILNG